ncbi:UNVERIFIED_CONTAM: L-ascorbate peroxidase 1, cytosolic [Siphonaria sp. JEL0065]|nr:L-ascorbate peroxidase 1, cytosolic [Siphonaria sp. JEL0065]
MAAEIPTTMTFGGHTFPAGTFKELQDAFVAHIEMPHGCGPLSPDMDPEAPSKALAALWLRGAFHDVGKFDPLFKTPVAGLLPFFLNETENTGIGDSIATRFAPQAKFPYSTADYIALAAQVTLAHCGGLSFEFLQGRKDAPETTTFSSLQNPLPDDNLDSYQTIKSKLRNLGFTYQDIVVLVTGSHSVGGVHKAISPHATTKEFEAFDSTPGIFDNDVFKQSLKGNCRLNIDCGIALDPELRPLVQLYANDEAAFFKQYQESFQKMTTLGQDRSKLTAFPLEVSLHKNLFAEEGVVAPSPGQGVVTGDRPSVTATATNAIKDSSAPATGIKGTSAVSTVTRSSAQMAMIGISFVFVTMLTL